MGHLLHYRHLAMRVLGSESESPYGKQFSDSGASDGSDYPSLSDLRDQWNRVHGQLESVMTGLAYDALEQAAPASSGPHGEKRVLDNVIFFTWHESYHMGALARISHRLTGQANDRPAITSLRLLAVLTVLFKYASARQAARASY